MAEENKKNIHLRIDGATATWELREEGLISGTYAGTFKFRCFLSPTQKIAANREYREILGPNPTYAPEHESMMAFALTQLKHRIIEAPPFWSSTLQESSMAGDIADDNIISLVLDAAIEAELQYKNNLKEKKDDVLKRAVKAAEALLIKKDQVESEEDEEEQE